MAGGQLRIHTILITSHLLTHTAPLGPTHRERVAQLDVEASGGSQGRLAKANTFELNRKLGRWMSRKLSDSEQAAVLGVDMTSQTGSLGYMVGG